MSETIAPWRLFDVYGIELEYMIVDRDSLAVKPITDEILRDLAGEYASEVERGDIAWSNELVLHVLEFKTNGPAASLAGLAERFQENIREANRLLAPRRARLLPTAAHPWMDPHRETRLWPHENSPIYDAFNRIFDCRGHGWSNLQSLHINLPFDGDDEFGRLHAAIRFLLPLMPALAASSPLLDGKPTGLLDSRLETYRHNCRRIPQATAAVVPEAAYSRDEYQRMVLDPLYAAIAPHDPDNILQEEWLNARGAIARFTRGSIEIRVLDLQECPQADLAVAGAICGILERLADGSIMPHPLLRQWPTERLANLLLRTIRDADLALIEDADYLAAWGLPPNPITARELWQHLADRWLVQMPYRAALDIILHEGVLGRRILAALGDSFDSHTLQALYGRLADALENGELFHA